MKELILNFHGLGEPPAHVEAEERRYWWPVGAFTDLLDRVVDYPAVANLRISVTFDDGNASDALLALPELTKRGLTASFFVCAGRIEKRYYLDSSMMHDLLDSGMAIGSHGMDHRDWRSLHAKELDTEISDARRKLEDIVQRPVTTVAIPFGSYDRRVLSRLGQDSWDCIYTSDRGTTRVEAKMKAREAVTDDMQYRDLINEFLASPSTWLRLRRSMSRVYKRLR
jgi:peptidoglycan/xylan/chitin deacetylase (PgdA/CDA1 family)